MDDPILQKYIPYLQQYQLDMNEDKLKTEFRAPLPDAKIIAPHNINFYKLQAKKNMACLKDQGGDQDSVDCKALRRISLASVRGVRNGAIKAKASENVIKGMPMTTFHGTCDDIIDEGTSVGQGSSSRSVSAQLQNAWDSQHLEVANIKNKKTEKRIQQRIREILTDPAKYELGDEQARPKVRESRDGEYNLSIRQEKIDKLLAEYIDDPGNTAIFDYIDELKWAERVATEDKEGQAKVLSECGLFAPAYRRAKLLALLRERLKKKLYEGQSVSATSSYTRKHETEERPKKDAMTEMETIAVCSRNTAKDILQETFGKIDLLHGSHILKQNNTFWHILCPAVTSAIDTEISGEVYEQSFQVFVPIQIVEFEEFTLDNKKPLPTQTILDWCLSEERTNEEYGKIITHLLTRFHDSCGIVITPKIAEMLYLAYRKQYRKRIKPSEIVESTSSSYMSETKSLQLQEVQKQPQKTKGKSPKAKGETDDEDALIEAAIAQSEKERKTHSSVTPHKIEKE